MYMYRYKLPVNPDNSILDFNYAYLLSFTVFICKGLI